MRNEEASLRGIQVLVVDDDSNTREVLVDLLTLSGATAIAVSSVDQAMKVLQTASPNVLLVDLLMPDQSGFALIRQLRAQGKLKSLPAAVVTAAATPEDRNHLLSVGFSEFITKPVNPEQLVEVVRRLSAAPKD